MPVVTVFFRIKPKAWDFTTERERNLNVNSFIIDNADI
jgi:hypothetical protein